MSRQFFTDSVNKCKIIEYKNNTTIIKKRFIEFDGHKSSYTINITLLI